MSKRCCESHIYCQNSDSQNETDLPSSGTRITSKALVWPTSELGNVCFHVEIIKEKGDSLWPVGWKHKPRRMHYPAEGFIVRKWMVVAKGTVSGVFSRKEVEAMGRKRDLFDADYHHYIMLSDLRRIEEFHQSRLISATKGKPMKERVRLFQYAIASRPYVERRHRAVEAVERKEGEQYRSEANFRQRNRWFIEEKKNGSDYRCEVCRKKMEEVYGYVGVQHIVAHHKNPIGGRKRSTKTTLADIALVCDNCHAMLHSPGPKRAPLKIGELRRLVKTGSAR